MMHPEDQPNPSQLYPPQLSSTLPNPREPGRDCSCQGAVAAAWWCGWTVASSSTAAHSQEERAGHYGREHPTMELSTPGTTSKGFL